jgi:predicted glycoside hydrolase/deacetylase ChbG (UPF0249 family)
MTERSLIVNADDLGYDPAVSLGLLRAMREGVVSSATLMVNTPFSKEAADGAAGLAIGLHLNLARHAPLWPGFPQALLTRGELDEARAVELPAEVVAGETRAQLDRARALLGRAPTHLDVHKHLHRHPAVLEGLAQVAKAQGLPVRSIDAQMRAALRARGVPTPDHFVGDAGTRAYWTPAQLQASLAVLAPGVTELMCHPGLRPSSVRSGYAAQREVELATFLDPAAREALAQAGIRLTTFGALAPAS